MLAASNGNACKLEELVRAKDWIDPGQQLGKLKALQKRVFNFFLMLRVPRTPDAQPQRACGQYATPAEGSWEDDEVAESKQNVDSAPLPDGHDRHFPRM